MSVAINSAIDGICAGVAALTLVGSSTYDQGTAAANTASINTAGSYGDVSISNPGLPVWLDPLVPIVRSSQSKLYLAAGLRLLSGPGRICPVIKPQYCGNVITGPQLVRAANVVTVSEAGHTKAVGDQVWVAKQSSSGTDSSFFGLVTVTAAVKSVSWSYASAGSNGTAGANTVFYALIPVRQTLAGTAFTATANYVTVSEPGHNKRAGFAVWIGQVGGSNFAPGVVTVTRVTADTWTYKTSAAVGAGTGTLALSYDFNIEIDGPEATIDGNRIGCGGVVIGSEMQLTVGFFGLVTGLRLNTYFTGSPVRTTSFFNCAAVLLDNGYSATDGLVMAQFEGGGQNIVVDQRLPSDGNYHTVTAQQADDYLAFTGTACVGGGGNYDNTTSPYGLTYFEGIEIRSLCGVNSANGIKLTATGALCPFLGTIKVGKCYMRNLDNAPLNAIGSFLKVFDDGAGLVGTKIDIIDFQGPFSWNSAPVAGSGGAISVSGSGSINAIYLRSANADASNLNSIGIAGSTIGLIDVDASRFYNSNIAATTHMTFSGGAVTKLKVRNSRIGMGSNTTYSIYLNGGQVEAIEVEACQVFAQDAASGTLIVYGSPAGLKSISLKGVRSESAAGYLSGTILIADIAVGTLDIYVDDYDMQTGSLVSTSGTGATGTVNVFLGPKVRWTRAGAGYLFRAGCLTWNIYGNPSVNALTEAGRAFLTGFGSPVYKSIGFSQDIASSSAPALDCGIGNIFTNNSGANATVTFGAPANVPPSGTPVTGVLTQDATGGRLYAWNAAYVFPTAWSNVGNTANKKSIVNFVSDGSKLIAQGVNAWY